MALLTTKRRKQLKKSQFADPVNKKFPIHDRTHAANALARIAQALKAGRISATKATQLRTRAQKALQRFSPAARKKAKK